jgi:hypothetical protein
MLLNALHRDDIIAAEYYTSKRGALLDINLISNGERKLLHTQPVSGKREARNIAVQYGASPWNF